MLDILKSYIYVYMLHTFATRLIRWRATGVSIIPRKFPDISERVWKGAFILKTWVNLFNVCNLAKKILRQRQYEFLVNFTYISPQTYIF